MNIFILDINPKVCASYHCDKHVTKMIVETCQMLSTTLRLGAYRIELHEDIKVQLYKQSFENHPCNIWIRESEANYYWTTDLLGALIEEYDKRFNNTKKFEVARGLYKVFSKISSILKLRTYNKTPQLTPFALAIPEQYKTINMANSIIEKRGYNSWIVDCYQAFYVGKLIDEQKQIKYNYSETPKWFEMGIAKRVAEMSNGSMKNSIMEAFGLGGIGFKPKQKIVQVNYKTGDTIKLKDNRTGIIMKNLSNLDIRIAIFGDSEEVRQFTKEDIVEVIETKLEREQRQSENTINQMVAIATSK